MIIGHAREIGERLLETTPALPFRVELLGKSVAVLALGLGGLVTGHALVPRTVCGSVNENALAVTRHAPLLPVCGLIAPGRFLLTTNGTGE